jgi:2-dehydropantoate 2-reductase
LEILKSQEAFIRSIMEEICRIADAIGHSLPDDLIDINIAITYSLPLYKTSMLLDYENGRPMETEAIIGNALRAGNRSGITSPHLESVYAMMKLRELKLGV